MSDQKDAAGAGVQAMSGSATEVVYLGHRTLSTGKVGEAWITLAALEGRKHTVEGFSSLFPKAKRGRYVIGGVYSSTAEVDDTGHLNRLRVGEYLRRLPSSTERTAWHASDEAADQRKRQGDLEKRLADDDGLEHDMCALREAWRSCPPGDRVAFELMVLRRMRNPK